MLVGWQSLLETSCDPGHRLFFTVSTARPLLVLIKFRALVPHSFTWMCGLGTTATDHFIVFIGLRASVEIAA